MGYSVELKELPAQLVLRAERTVTLDTIAQGIGQAFDAVTAQAMAGGARFSGPPFVIYPEECVGTFRLQLCMPVDAGCAAPARDSGVELVDVPGAAAACVTHQGPYDRIGGAYEALGAWLSAEGRRPAGPPREIYLNDPGQVEPARLLTEVAWPVA